MKASKPVDEERDRLGWAGNGPWFDAVGVAEMER